MITNFSKVFLWAVVFSICRFTPRIFPSYFLYTPFPSSQQSLLLPAVPSCEVRARKATERANAAERRALEADRQNSQAQRSLAEASAQAQFKI